MALKTKRRAYGGVRKVFVGGGKKKEKKKQGSLLATSMIGSHVDKVRKKKQETPTIIHIQLQKNGDTATTGYWGYQGLRYRYGELTRKGSPV